MEVAVLLPALAGKKTKDLLPESRLTSEFMVILLLYLYLIVCNLEIPELHILSLASHGKSSCTASVLAIYAVR